MHKFLWLNFIFSLEALHVPDYISPSSGATFYKLFIAFGIFGYVWYWNIPNRIKFNHRNLRILLVYIYITNFSITRVTEPVSNTASDFRRKLRSSSKTVQAHSRAVDESRDVNYCSVWQCLFAVETKILL